MTREHNDKLSIVTLSLLAKKSYSGSSVRASPSFYAMEPYNRVAITKRATASKESSAPRLDRS
jgi:hypothetical protein